MLEFDGEGYLDIEHYYDELFPMDYPDDIMDDTGDCYNYPDLPFIPF